MDNAGGFVPIPLKLQQDSSTSIPHVGQVPGEGNLAVTFYRVRDRRDAGRPADPDRQDSVHVVGRAVTIGYPDGERGSATRPGRRARDNAG